MYQPNRSPARLLCEGPVRSAGSRVLRDNCSRRAVPRQLGVALVAGDQNAALAAPGCGGRKVVQLPCRVAGTVHPQQQSALDVFLADRVRGEPKPEVLVDRHRYSPQTCQKSTHLVGGVGELGVKDSVARRVAQVQPRWKSGDKLLGADTERDLRRVYVDPEAPCHPFDDSLASGRRSGRRRVPASRTGLICRT